MIAEPSRTPPTGGIDAPGHDVFRLLVEGVRDYAIFMLNPDGVIASWNAGAERIKGYAAAEAIGRHFSMFYTREAIAMDWPSEELRRARALGRFEDEGWRVRKDGSRFWANVVITALHGDDGELLGYAKVTRDLTERREHEERLRQSEEDLRLLVESVKDHAIFMLDTEGRVQTWNAGGERCLGYAAAEAIGQHAAIFYTDEDKAAKRPQTELAIAMTTGFSEEVGWRVKQGGLRFWADSSLTSLRHPDGRPRGFVQIVRDLSERRRVQQLEIEGKRINEFIAMLAHELRNPLAPIGNAVGIMEKLATTPELAWCTKLIGRQVVHMARLVDDLLDVSRITSGKIQLRKELVELNVVIAGAIESVRPTVSGYGHTLELSLPDEPVQVEGDPTRLTQVVVNLVNNAAKYTPNGGRVQVRLERRGGVASIHVVDNGIGMSQQLIDTAFEMFVQGDRTLDRSEGGLGIGLTLVKRIVALHGGTVSAASAGPGHGSEFTVRLPMATRLSTSPGDDLAHSDGPRRLILVVDDNEDAAQSLAMLLQMSGHDARIARDGPEAVRIAASHPPDTVLLDIGLPGMNGHEVARCLRDIPSLAGTRIIAMTGDAPERDPHTGGDAAFHAWLVKPIDSDALLNLLAAPRSA